MIIVNPDQISILYVLGHCLREQTVNFLVSGPCALIESDLSGVVVEEGPEDGIYHSN